MLAGTVPSSVLSDTIETTTSPVGSVFSTTVYDPVSASSLVTVSIGFTVTPAVSSSVILATDVDCVPIITSAPGLISDRPIVSSFSSIASCVTAITVVMVAGDV